MKRKMYAAAAVVLCTAVWAGCGRNSGNSQGVGERKDQAADAQRDVYGQELPDSSAQGQQTVDLTVWGAEEDAELMKQVINGFQEAYQGQADFQITYEVQGESSCKDVLLGDLEEGADVFAFADDQVHALAAAGAIEPVADADTIRAEHLERAVEAASVGDTMYAYPLTADNGYFLYYNKEYFTEEDVASLERILDLAAAHDKLFAMDWSSGWYVYAFFGNTGLEVGLSEDGITNACNWNETDSEITGVEVAQAMLDLAANPGFSNRPDAEFLTGVQDGSVIAGVSGVWNAVAVEQAWGENFAASKLPTYRCGGRQVQMASFSGCKLIGVNAYSEHPQWAAKLAEWMVSKKNQQLRFALRGQGPSNREAAQSAQVQESPAIAALLAQSEFSHLQRVGGKFWDPVTEFAGNMADGNPTGADLQEQLDRMVDGITAR